MFSKYPKAQRLSPYQGDPPIPLELLFCHYGAGSDYLSKQAKPGPGGLLEPEPPGVIKFVHYLVQMDHCPNVTSRKGSYPSSRSRSEHWSCGKVGEPREP